ncbi:HAD-superfamily hydrolase, subfamily IA, variant 3 [Deinococcus proteolyticus MRP]|uniref:HAD-superfamily hydrolase, subfamily IA, variant 3 n=1 Tax=Deinococcus proteolyticus (strain ATCC 35074 / DSM 20540 / JCM 6276 / NBRC 101906 / NCIMB 13154 / VKM Ac-1939 / CCM 2703 / MRP) TaxID=693977 RepID=F0RJE2_DEIPM|nr:HAD-IA family hydrolase [Deinococcus proteolyticus]ADY25483.1 HAD-superfamily hydrolase, subfamily IA, variant 3 [Deinococcus proteolyticus MRP]
MTSDQLAPHAIQALLFDFDGTIMDTETTEFRHWQRLYGSHGRELHLRDWQRGIGTWGAFDPWAGLPQEVQADRERVGGDLHRGLLEELRGQDLRPGVVRLLDEAQAAGLRLALVTSSDRAWVTEWLTQHGLLDRFETLCTKDDVARVKPDPELYALAVRRLGLRPEACVAVEDSLNGATAAVAAGVRAVVVPNEVTASQPFPPAWPRLEDFSGGLSALLAALDG